MSLFRSRMGLMVLVGAISMFVLAIGPAGAQADDTFNVTTTADTPNGDDNCQVGDCSLRQAVEQASNGSDDGDNDTINVPAGTYNLDNGELEPYRCEENSGSLTITGAGARDTIIDGQSLDRVFDVECGVVTITDLTIQHGLASYGAGIYIESDGEVTLRNVAVIDNVADDCPQIDVAPSDTNGPSSDCNSGYGGGIENDGVLHVLQSLIAGNTAKGGGQSEGGYGGGIYNEGYAMDLTNVTLNNNVAENTEFNNPQSNAVSTYPGTGGGIFQEPYFFAQSTNGSKQIFDPTAHLLNVTIAGNTAGFGGGVSTGYIASAASTNETEPIAIDFKNTIVADNTSTVSICVTNQVCADTNITSGTDNCYLWQGTSASLGNNLESDTSCEFTEPGDIQNGNAALGALANNGGPTNTMALQDGSQALDTANNSGCPGTDQRYVTRPQNVTCDIGAYEKEVTPPAPPAQGGTAAATAAKPVAKSSISGPKSCTKGKATVKVSGQNISSVTYSLDGKKIKTAKGNKTSVTVNLAHKKSGVHRVTAKVSYSSATAASSQTKRFTVSRCARAAAKPKFTG